MKIKVISAYDVNYQSLSDITFPTIIKFCKKNNFDFERILIQNYDRPPAWFKIKHLLLEMENNKYDYFLWVDVDAIVFNFDFNLISIIEDKDFYISEDFNGLNTGVFLIKNCENMKVFFLEVYNNIKHLYHNTWEQASIIELINNNFKNIKDRVKIIEQNIFNAYDYFLYGFDSSKKGHYNEKSFIIHYPSLPYNMRLNEINKILKIKNYD